MSYSDNNFVGAAKHEAVSILRRAQDGRCAYCQQYITHRRMTLDHVMPKRVGGLDVFENLLAVCRPCNGEKGGQLPIVEFHIAILRAVHARIREEQIGIAA